MLIPPIPVGITELSIPFVLAAFNGFLLAIFLWFRNPINSKPLPISKASEKLSQQKIANRLLAGLLLVFSLMLIEHVADLGGYFFNAPHLIYMVNPLFFLIGPLLLGYVLCQTSIKWHGFQYRHLLHLVPVLFQILVLLPFYFSGSAEAKLFYFYEDLFPDLISEDELNASCDNFSLFHWQDCFFVLSQVTDNAVYDLVLRSPLALLWLYLVDTIVLCLSLLSYTLFTLFVLRKHKQRLLDVTSSHHLRDLNWIKHFVFLLLAAVILYVALSFQSIVLNTVWLEEEARNYSIYLILSVAVLYVGLQALKQPAIFSPALARTVLEIDLAQDSGLDKNQVVSKNNPSIENPNKYRNSALTTNLAVEIHQQLVNELVENKSYLNADLSLPELAEQLSVSSHILSQVLNETAGMNFFDFVNSYRLDEVKHNLINQPENSILQTAMNAGFNSKTSFYSFFKKHEGLTPSQWRKKHA